MKKKEKPVRVPETLLKVLPVRSYDDEINCFTLEDTSLFDIFEIVTADRENAGDDEVRFSIYAMARFYRLYSPDIKIISLNFPVNTAMQRKALIRATEQTNDPVRRLWLRREIQELIKLDENMQRKEFFMMIFADSVKSLEKNRQDVMSLIGMGRSKAVRAMEKDKKLKIVRKLCNMNTLLLPDELMEEDVFGEED